MDFDPGIREFATEKQGAYIDAVISHGSQSAAAKALGVSANAVQKGINAARLRAAKKGYSPKHDMVHTVPEGFNVKGVSTYYDKDGNVKAQWLKSSVDQDAMKAALEASLEAMCQDIPRAKPLPAPTDCDENLCNLYTITDYHMGMLAWGKEGGDDWDVDIAERTLETCFGGLIANSPAASTGIICQLGDFVHFDGLQAMTPTSGHILDADSRFQKVVEITVTSLRNVVDMALHKHDRVHVIMAEGNHDIASSVWLRTMFAALYENEPRVTCDTSPLPYYKYVWGKNFLGFHHGHMKKKEDLPSLFAAQFRREWGETDFGYAHCGHLHSKHVFEKAGMTVTQHRTLSPRDAYAARGGWFSERQIDAITYHKEYGEVGSTNVTPEMFGL